MDMEAVIIFPHHLFETHPAVMASRQVYLVEEWLFFNQYNFHKQKLILHRASMQFYKQYLEASTADVQYIDAQQKECDVRALIKVLATKNIQRVHVAALTDDWLTRRLVASCKRYNIECVFYQTPGFITSPEDATAFFREKRFYFQTDFYIHQRRQFNILLDARNNPAGGKWSYDEENRLRFPKGEIVPRPAFTTANEYVQEARNYVARFYNNNYGDAASPFHSRSDIAYPVTFTEAACWLDYFLSERFKKFGVYQDAMVAAESILYHSLLSPLLNIGLLTPAKVISKSLAAASVYNIPLNSLEGFIRQLLGWREFIKIVYEREGRKQRTTNHWHFKRKISFSFRKAATGILPVDTVIIKVLQSGYCHHIERLMVLGNFMLLCEFDPDEVYKWFMEMFVDAYDWVMVPNVYGMSQFADGGLMATKPYISGSNYLIKMGNWKKGAWQEIWDALFWRFIHVHRSFFVQNARLGLLVNKFDKMPAAKRNSYLVKAEQYLQSLDS